MQTPRSSMQTPGTADKLKPPVHRPATSPYFAKPFIPDAVLGQARPGTGPFSSPPVMLTTPKTWHKPRLGEVSLLFDPGINQFSNVRSEAASSQGHRPRTSSSIFSAATDSKGRSPQSRARKICRPQLWGGGQSAKSKFFDNLQVGEMDRNYFKRTLGPSFGGERKKRIAPGLLDAEAMNTPGVLEARALSEILDVVQMEEGVFDGWWLNPSNRALWYVPRTLCKLHRWEEFIELVCTLDHTIESSLEFGLPHVEIIFDTALRYIDAQISNTSAFITLAQRTIVVQCENTIRAYLEFLRDNNKALAAAPRKAFSIALAAQGKVRDDAQLQINELKGLVHRYSARLPLTDLEALVRIHQTLERASQHGLDACLPADDYEEFLSVSEDLRQVMSRMWQSANDGGALETCADLLLGHRSLDSTSKNLQKMSQEGFNDLVLIMSGTNAKDSPTPAEAFVVLTIRRPQSLSEADLLRVIAQHASVRHDQLQIVQKRGISVVLRIFNPLQVLSGTDGDRVVGDSGGSSIFEVRDKILKMANDPTSAIRKSGMVSGVGNRGGRWENVRMALCNTCDMDYEREYIATFVLPAFRAKCRSRKINFTWSSLGSQTNLFETDQGHRYCEAVNRMHGVQLCGFHPPGSHKRPFLLSLIGSRCEDTYQDIKQCHVNKSTYLRDPILSASLEWIKRDDYRMYSIPYLQTCEAYLRCIDVSQSFFILRDVEWLSDPKVIDNVPGIVIEEYFEHTDEMKNVVAEFKRSIEHNANRQSRIIKYTPDFSNFLGPKSDEDSAEMPKNVLASEYRRMRSVTMVNKVFWQAMIENGEHVVKDCRNIDLEQSIREKGGTISKKDVRKVLEKHNLTPLLSDIELVRLIAAYEVDSRGNVDYEGMLHQFLGKGRVRMGGMAKLGLSVYTHLCSVVDAYFPISVQPGHSNDKDLNDQEILLDIYATTASAGVNDHISRQLKDFAHSDHTLGIVAVRGSGGSGRSTLLAALARHCIVELGHITDVIYFCLQPWHNEQDIFRCLLSQIDSNIVRHCEAAGEALSVSALGLGLGRQAQSRRKDVLIIADGLLSSEMENLLASVVKTHNSTSMSNRVRIVFSAVSAEHHSASDVLTLSILPMTPGEKMKLVKIQEYRASISLCPQVAIDLCKKPRNANNAKFLVVAVNFLSKLQEREHSDIVSEMPDNVRDLYSSTILPFLEIMVGETTIQHILGLLYFEQKGGLLRSEMAKLARPHDAKPFMKEHELYELCESLRFLGIAAVTADEDRFVISCEEVRNAIYLRYVSRDSILHDKFENSFKREKSLRMSKRSSTGECLEAGVVPTQRKKMVNLSRINTVNTNERKEGFGGSRSVNLQNNNLTSVPSDILSKSSAPEEIAQLCLGSNSIMKIDQRIANLANLLHLDLSVNCILYLPEEVGLLSNLEFLDVSDNQIKEVGASIWGLSHLHTLRFRQNHISKLSDRLGSLTSLQELNFSNNELCSIPETITQLTNLEKIDLSGNILVEIPDLIAFTNLRVLHLASNRFSSVPSLCFNLELEDLDLESNLLECMPAMATTYPNLKRVVFAGNRMKHLELLSGCLALESLNVCDNELEKFPAEFSMCSNLKVLALANNKIKVLPKGVCSLNNLITLDVSSNQIREVPSEVIQLSSLQSLFLSENLLTALPIELCSMPHITQLEFDNNQIDLDDPVCKMKRLQREAKISSPRSVHRTSSGWEDHHAQMAILQSAGRKQDEERILQRKLALGDRRKSLSDNPSSPASQHPERSEFSPF